MTIYLSLLIAIIGLIGYLLPPGNAKRETLCLYAYVVGLLAFLLQIGGHSIPFLK